MAELGARIHTLRAAINASVADGDRVDGRHRVRQRTRPEPASRNHSEPNDRCHRQRCDHQRGREVTDDLDGIGPGHPDEGSEGAVSNRWSGPARTAGRAERPTAGRRCARGTRARTPSTSSAVMTSAGRPTAWTAPPRITTRWSATKHSEVEVVQTPSDAQSLTCG